MSPHLGCYGDKVAKTPNIDRLASQGIRYTNVFTTAAISAPVQGRNNYRDVPDFNWMHAYENHILQKVS